MAVLDLAEEFQADVAWAGSPHDSRGKVVQLCEYCRDPLLCLYVLVEVEDQEVLFWQVLHL